MGVGGMEEEKVEGKIKVERSWRIKLRRVDGKVEKREREGEEEERKEEEEKKKVNK